MTQGCDRSSPRRTSRKPEATRLFHCPNAPNSTGARVKSRKYRLLMRPYGRLQLAGSYRHTVRLSHGPEEDNRGKTPSKQTASRLQPVTVTSTETLSTEATPEHHRGCFNAPKSPLTPNPHRGPAPHPYHRPHTRHPRPRSGPTRKPEPISTRRSGLRLKDSEGTCETPSSNPPSPRVLDAAPLPWQLNGMPRRAFITHQPLGAGVPRSGTGSACALRADYSSTRSVPGMYIFWSLRTVNTGATATEVARKPWTVNSPGIVQPAHRAS